MLPYSVPYPRSIYLGKTERDPLTRFFEHTRDGVTVCDKMLATDLAKNASAKLYILPAPKSMLDDLERFGIYWIAQNVSEIQMRNSSSGSGTSKCCQALSCVAPEATLEELGQAVPDFSLDLISGELADVEKECASVRPWIEQLGQIHDNLSLQVVSKDQTGKYKIIAGHRMMLTAQLASSKTAFGNVIVVDDMCCRGSDFRTTVQEYAKIKQTMRRIPNGEYDTVCGIAKDFFLARYKPADIKKAISNSFRPWVALAEMLSIEGIGKSQIKKRVSDFEKAMSSQSMTTHLHSALA